MPKTIIPTDPLLDVEHLLSHIFGKRSAHGLASGLEAESRTWEKYRRKLLDHLEHYVTANLVTDRVHSEQIQNKIRQLRQATRLSTEVRESYLVSYLVGLCLVLLGEMPDHWDKKVVGHHKYFKLDRHRSVHYTQSPEQKAALIWDELKKQKLANFGSEANTKYSHARRTGQYTRFIEWYRTSYPKEYVNLFG